MGVRRLWLVLAALLVPAGANASGHNWDVFFAFSAQRVKGAEEEQERAKRLGARSFENPVLAGGHFTVAASKHGWRKELTLAVDFSSNVVELSEDGRRDLGQTTLMGGPRWTFLHGRYLPIVQVMPLGITHNAGGRSIGVPDTSFVASVGGGLEWVPDKAAFGQWGLRLQVDHLFLFSGPDQQRLSLGLILRFAEKWAEKDAHKAEEAAEKAAKERAKKGRP